MVLENIIYLILVLALWEAVWKGIALWKCGRYNQLYWFVAIFILNTVGILPIIYLLAFQKKAPKKAQVVAKPIKKRRR